MSDTGPPYPPVLPGADSFGRFTFGISAFGLVPKFSPWYVMQSEYSNSPVLDNLILLFFSAADQTGNFETFFDNMWNIETAQGYGLDVWGRIVGIVRELEVSTGKYVGFEEGGTLDYDTLGPGGSSPFYAGQPSTSSYSLSDDAFRQLILAKAAFNIIDGFIPAINSLLMNLFGSNGRCYVADNGGMSLTWTFDFQLTALQEAIIFQSGIMPKTVGVAANVVINA